MKFTITKRNAKLFAMVLALAAWMTLACDLNLTNHGYGSGP